MDLGFLPGGGRETEQGRPPVRHADGTDQPTRWTGSARCSPPMARSSSMRRATSPSSPTRPGRCSTGSRSWCRTCRPMSSPGTTSSNNKALVSGKSALIMNPPSAWAVAKRDAPQVAQNLWTFGPPKGPKGRMMPFLPYYWTIWKFSLEQVGGEGPADLSVAGERRSSGWSRQASGYDIPPYRKLDNFNIWSEVGPPEGTIYSYPPRYDDEIDLDRDGAGAAEYRGADVHAGDQHEDDRAMHAAGQDDRSTRSPGPPTRSRALCAAR